MHPPAAPLLVVALLQRVRDPLQDLHVTSGRLLDDVSLALSSNRLPAHLLELEVVESSLLVNPELAAQTLRDLKRMGVGLALDDFGTGYSSLGYLKHYPFDELKIDQMFTRNVNRVPEDAAIVRSTIALAHNLGMRVLAEGVETESQLRFLARYGCDQMQGYLFSRPTEPAVVETAVMERSDLRREHMHWPRHAPQTEDTTWRPPGPQTVVTPWQPREPATNMRSSRENRAGPV